MKRLLLQSFLRCCGAAAAARKEAGILLFLEAGTVVGGTFCSVFGVNIIVHSGSASRGSPFAEPKILVFT